MTEKKVTRTSMARSSIWHGLLWVASVGLYGKRTGSYERAKQVRDEKRAIRSGARKQHEDAPVEARQT